MSEPVLDISVDGIPEESSRKPTGKSYGGSLAVSLLMAVQDRFEFDPPWMISFRHEGAPQSKARARVSFRNGRPRAWTPEQTRAAEESLSWHWRMATKGETRDGNLAVACVFFRPNRQRIDADNMLKLVLDAATKARVWHDDSQVTTIVSRIEFDEENPRSEICLMPTESTLDRNVSREAVCEQCGKAWRKSYNSQSSGRFCSGACAQASKRVIAICINCEGEFLRKRAGQRLCSNACKDASQSKRISQAVAEGRAKGPPLCEKCGARVSRREYKQCAACLGRGRPKNETERAE